MTSAERVLEALDFQPSCVCGGVAKHFVAFHNVGHCCGRSITVLQCDTCLAVKERAAAFWVKRLQPGLWRRLCGLRGVARCPSCQQQQVQLESDVVQIVRGLKP